MMCRFTNFYLLTFITLIVSFIALGEKGEQNCGKCGRRIPALEAFRIHDRIIDGRQVIPVYKYPWVVKIEAARTCSGSIISKRYILTSAYCLTKVESDNNHECMNGKMPNECYVEAGHVRVRLPWRESTRFRQTLIAEKLRPHPDYEPSCKKNDIALIRVPRDIQCNSFKQPICLPTLDVNKIGKTLTVTGWGETTPDGIPGSKLLREGEMKQVIFDHCLIYHCFEKNYTKAICAVGTNIKQTPCKGDSGAVTFASFNRAYYALGVTSLPEPFHCQPSKAIPYTKVQAYIDWIKKYVKKFPEPYTDFARLQDLEIDNEPFEF